MVNGDVLRPSSVEELAEIVRRGEPLAFDSEARSVYDLPRKPAQEISLGFLNAPPEVFAADQVAVLSREGEFASKLEAAGFELPHCGLTGAWLGTLGATVDFNLPHGREASFGTWRDWILGMTIMLADGLVVKGGSKAVKNVAGYDLHKLMIGARGALGIILDVTVRLSPLSSAKPSSVELGRGWDTCRTPWIQRTLHADFERAVAGAGKSVVALDRPSSTLWADVEPGRMLERFGGDWVLRGGCGDENYRYPNAVEAELALRAKALFDPNGRLNPGALP